MEWLDIKQNIPEFEEPVLLFGEDRILIARLFRRTQTADSFTLDFHVGDLGMEELWITPTHWMPLPKVP